MEEQVGIAPTRGSPRGSRLAHERLPTRPLLRSGQGGRLRTGDLLAPNEARYWLRHALIWSPLRVLPPLPLGCSQAPRYPAQGTRER